MKFQMNNLNPGTWFPFDESKPEEGGICVRVLNTKKLAEIRDQTITTKREFADGRMHEYQEVDHAGRDRIIWDYCIVDWKDLIDDEENPIECTTENKILLMNEHIGSSAFVETCLDKLNAQAGILLEESEKN